MIHDYKMASGSDDGTVIIWNWLNGQLVHTLTGHSMTVSLDLYDELTLVSASWDSTVKFWNISR